MEDNVWVFACIHGRFSEELVKSVEMTVGEAGNAFTFSLVPGTQPGDYRAILEKQLEKLDDGKILYLVDLFGGTSYTACVVPLKAYDMQVISGLNPAMYTEVTSQRNLRPGQELVKVELEILRDSGKDVVKLLNERK